MSAKDVTITTPDGDFGAYLASPAAGAVPASSSSRRFSASTRSMRDIADGFAAHGYFALARTCSGGIDPGVELTDQTEAEWKRAFELCRRIRHRPRASRTSRPPSTILRGTRRTGKVGAVGYCLGGLLAYLTATRTDSDASVGYYGVGIQRKLAEAEKHPITR